MDTFSFKRIARRRASGDLNERFSEMDERERRFANSLGNWARSRWARAGYGVSWLRDRMSAIKRLELRR